MKWHSIYLFRDHIVFYPGDVYNIIALSSPDGKTGDRSMLSPCVSCDRTVIHSTERLPMKTAVPWRIKAPLHQRTNSVCNYF